MGRGHEEKASSYKVLRPNGGKDVRVKKESVCRGRKDSETDQRLTIGEVRYSWTLIVIEKKH